MDFVLNSLYTSHMFITYLFKFYLNLILSSKPGSYARLNTNVNQSPDTFVSPTKSTNSILFWQHKNGHILLNYTVTRGKMSVQTLPIRGFLFKNITLRVMMWRE
jgi:hypothetical protein